MQNEITLITFGTGTTAITATTETQDEQCYGVSPSLYSYRLYQSSRYVMQQHQDMVNRHTLCLTHLREASDEADALRMENATLKSVNYEIKQQFNLLMRSSVQNQLDCNTTPFQVLSDLSNLSLVGEEAGEHNRAVNWGDVCGKSPTSVIEKTDLKRSSLPKSISLRSNEYLKANHVGGAGQGGKSRGAMTKPGNSSQLTNTQKVYLRGGKKQDEAVELEVYNQGMLKTELCNKWQQTGSCPYGDQCQFAHGIEELRPVIRQPRYKTEVCRMVLAGDVCPYGHRCHFRHALTENEKLTG